jgi:prepilin peptidase CpaA
MNALFVQAASHQTEMIDLRLLAAPLVLAVLAAAWVDIRERRIPNALTLAMVLVALGGRAVFGGGPLVDGLFGAGLALVIMLPLFAMGGVGGGDAKLLIGVGAFLGPKGFIVAMLATALAGGLMSVLYAVRRGVILPVLLNAGGLARYALSAGRAGERTTAQSEGAVNVPYGVAIAAGTLIAVWYGMGAT